MFLYPRRSVTREIVCSVGLDIQLVIGDILEGKQKAGIQMDYLQIFAFTIECALGQVYPKITWRQEQPTNRDTLYITGIAKPLITTLWVIYDGEYATLLYPSDY